MNRSQKAVVVGVTIYATTIAAFRGEFWPFSTFPMFSRAGRPWTHATVRECADASAARADQWVVQEQLPCAPLALDSIGLHQNDLSALVRDVAEGAVSQDRIPEFFAGSSHEREWAVYLATGSIDERGDPSVRYRLVAIVPGDHRATPYPEP